MSYRKEILTAVGTLGCAVGIGFVMQSTESAHQLYGTQNARAEAQAVINTKHATTSFLEVQQITLTAAEVDSSVERPATDPEVVKVSAPQAVQPAPESSAEAPAPKCDITANARPIAAAMVRLSLSAPCFASERVTVHHNGMIFTQTTDINGEFELSVPALATNATFVVAFSNGDGGVAQAAIEDLGDFDRVVLQWKGHAGFEIHAREFGADYGDDGHVWNGESRDLGYAAAGQGGFITRLGDDTSADPLIAEVYTFPTREIQQIGVVDLSVETEVTTANCGSEIEAQAMQMRGADQITTRNLTLAVPDCDAAGSFLVLNNLLEDLKVAGN